ncbi:hypothetical protein C8R46DRAFT_1207248 [Mycena filopes]|nr:hypothetical protein C8R46DRAFT_1207248 [Mycena filopes]
MSIKPIDKASIHRITSGQVVIDLQTAVKELVENSLDAGATNLEVRFKQYGLSSIEVVDNGGGISEENYEGLALKNHTSKLSSFADLTTVTTFGFRGEALSSLCALCESVVVSTATQPPMGVTLEMASSGKVEHKGKVARQRGTTITLTNLFSTLPVRRKEFERNAKREFGKALMLLNARIKGEYGSVSGLSMLTPSRAKSVQIRTSGTPSLRESVSALWGPKALDNIVPLDIRFSVERDKVAMKRSVSASSFTPMKVHVRGLVSKFAVGCGRSGTDRQFFYVNGRPCNLTKIQKAFNEVYRSFNATHSPFLVADFILPTDACDINVSPDKRSILLHHEANLISALKTTLESTFAGSRSTYDVEAKSMTQTLLPGSQSLKRRSSSSVTVLVESDEEEDEGEIPSTAVTASRPPRTAKTASTSGPAAEAGKPEVVVSPVVRETPIQHPKESPFLLPTARSTQPKPKHDSPTAGPSKPKPTPAIHPPSALPSTALETPPFMAPVKHPRDSPFLLPIAPPHDSGPAKPKPTPAIHAPSSSTSSASESPIEMDDVVVTLDASRRASWLQRTRKVPDEADAESVGEGHPRKKRRSEVEVEVLVSGEVDEDAALPSPSQRPKGTKSAAQSLRTMLVGFSAAGSQPAVQVEGEEEEDELEDELEASGDHGEVSPLRPSKDRGDTEPVSGGEEEEEGGMEIDSPGDDSADIGPRGHEDTDVGMQDVPDAPSSVARPSNVEDEQDEDDDMIIQPDPDTSTSLPLNSSSIIDLTDDDMFDSSELSGIVPELPLSSTPSLDEVVSRPEVIRTADGGRGDVSLRFDLSKISNSWRRLCDSVVSAAAEPEHQTAASSKVLQDAGITDAVSDDVATEALARTISKGDFGTMDILGQFNLGFIVTRRRTTTGGAGMDDLFIVDQHAADEKYNFETLQQTTRIKSQKLFRAQPLELTAGDELVALENLDVLRQNGFEVDESQAATDDDDSPAQGQGARLSLTAQPISKDTVFDMKDLEELIHRMRDQPAGQMVRCSKARAMFAMRACRKSVMIGMPLTKGQMTSVVRHMGTMDQPWNCPHGRPTMRHLADILGAARARRGVAWAGFGAGDDQE